MEILSGGCTLDCFDACKFNVHINNNEVIKVEGDKNHPYTQGMICSKGRRHIERHNHPKRQYNPLLKVNGVWKEISFEEALNIMEEKLNKCLKYSGSKSIMYYEQYGSGSVLKSIGDIFFNFIGGCAKQKGGPCWSAGIMAQKINFGDVKSHSLDDLKNSKNIIIWGKNPAHTSIHTMKMIKEAQRQGSYVIVIDPICTATAKQADYYIGVKPGGDGALALAIAKIIIDSNLYDSDYINKYVNGFNEYKEYLNTMNLEELYFEAGVSKDVVHFLVNKYTEKYSTILMGYGMQKYYYGGSTIGYINTLGAITGQIGYAGGGINYANYVYPGVLNLDPYNSEKYAENDYFYVSEISSYIKHNNIQLAVITKSNLLNQLPQLNDLEKALNLIDFKICFDLFLTDTAQACDLFIPTTSVFESEDLLFSSMSNPYLTYIEKALNPKDILMDEYYFFKTLAKRLKIREYPYVKKSEYLEKIIEPLRRLNKDINLNYIKNNYVTIDDDIPWKNKKFETESGRFEIFINANVREIRKNKIGNLLRLITNHGKDTLFSQHYMDNENISKAYINTKMAKRLNISQDDILHMKSSEGEIKVHIIVDNNIGDDIVMMYAGWWKKHGNPNWIIKSGISDIGGQVTYNETFVKLYKK